MVWVICQFYFLVFIMSMVSTVRAVRVYDEHYGNSNSKSDVCLSVYATWSILDFYFSHCTVRLRDGERGRERRISASHLQ